MNIITFPSLSVVAFQCWLSAPNRPVTLWTDQLFHMHDRNPGYVSLPATDCCAAIVASRPSFSACYGSPLLRSPTSDIVGHHGIVIHIVLFAVYRPRLYLITLYLADVTGWLAGWRLPYPTSLCLTSSATLSAFDNISLHFSTCGWIMGHIFY